MHIKKHYLCCYFRKQKSCSKNMFSKILSIVNRIDVGLKSRTLFEHGIFGVGVILCTFNFFGYSETCIIL